MPEPLPYFPLFIPLEGRRVILIGAGKIAARRTAALLPFGSSITVIAPEACPELEDLASQGKITLLRREYRPGDMAGARLAVAASNSRKANRAAGEECRRLGIPVSVADSRKECTFYFPAIASEGSVVAGLTASGESHKLVKRLASRLRALLPRLIQEEAAPTDV